MDSDSRGEEDAYPTASAKTQTKPEGPKPRYADTQRQFETRTDCEDLSVCPARWHLSSILLIPAATRNLT